MQAPEVCLEPGAATHPAVVEPVQSKQLEALQPAVEEQQSQPAAEEAVRPQIVTKPLVSEEPVQPEVVAEAAQQPVEEVVAEDEPEPVAETEGQEVSQDAPEVAVASSEELPQNESFLAEASEPEIIAETAVAESPEVVEAVVQDVPEVVEAAAEEVPHATVEAQSEETVEPQVAEAVAEEPLPAEPAVSEALAEEELPEPEAEIPPEEVEAWEEVCEDGSAVEEAATEELAEPVADLPTEESEEPEPVAEVPADVPVAVQPISAEDLTEAADEIEPEALWEPEPVTDAVAEQPEGSATAEEEPSEAVAAEAVQSGTVAAEQLELAEQEAQEPERVEEVAPAMLALVSAISTSVMGREALVESQVFREPVAPPELTHVPAGEASAETQPEAVATTVGVAEPLVEPGPESVPEGIWSAPPANIQAFVPTSWSHRPAQLPPNILAPVPALQMTLPGPSLPPQLESFQDASIVTVLGTKPRRRRSSVPGWLISLIVALILLVGGVGVLFYVVPTGATESRGIAPTDRSVSVASSSAQEVSQSLNKSLEITGLRIRMGADKKSEISYVVVNHSSTEIADVTVHVTVRSSNSRPQQIPICNFAFRLPSIGANEAREMTSLIEVPVRSPGLPDWQSLKADFQITP